MTKPATKPTIGQRIDAQIARAHTAWWNLRFDLGYKIGAFTRASRASWRSKGWL